MAAQVPQTVLNSGGVEVDLLTREVRRDGQLVRLSTTEFELLAYLMRNRGQVLTREQILRAVWGYEYDPGTNVVDVYVGYLRRKLRGPGARSTSDRGDGSRSHTPITTIRSVGYRFDASQ
jgi:DNA-binding response OmpR family regulator